MPIGVAFGSSALAATLRVSSFDQNIVLIIIFNSIYQRILRDYVQAFSETARGCWVSMLIDENRV